MLHSSQEPAKSIVDRRLELRQLARNRNGWWQLLQILRQLQQLEPGVSSQDYARTTDNLINDIMVIEFNTKARA